MKSQYLPSTTITVYFYTRDGDIRNLVCIDPTVTVENNLYKVQYISTYGIKTNCVSIKIGDKLFLHNQDAPALHDDEGGEIDFFLYGQPVKIEHLPCDDETKTILLLKYSLKQEEDTYYGEFYSYE